MTDVEAEKKLKILSALTGIHHSIGRNLELEEISHILVEELVNIVSCAGCAILLIERDRIKILAEKGFWRMLGEKKFSAEMLATKYIVNTKQSICTGDIMNSPSAGCVPYGCFMNSFIGTPIIVNDEVRGIIHLDSPKKNAFDEEDLHFAEWLSKEVSVILERSFLHSQAKALSIKDGLTGCFNRRKFDEDIEAQITRAKRYETCLSLLMIDIDSFKKYNDFHGHAKGDVLLKKMVGIFTRTIRAVDKVYRYGGEEFVILLPETDKEKAFFTARRLQKIIEQEEFEGEMESQPHNKITISIGVASFPVDKKDKSGLIKYADSALYRAKQSGKNRAHAFNEQNP
jgi:diguanylate cyclase (GGDEF)-like protein